MVLLWNMELVMMIRGMPWLQHVNTGWMGVDTNNPPICWQPSWVSSKGMEGNCCHLNQRGWGKSVELEDHIQYLISGATAWGSEVIKASWSSSWIVLTPGSSSCRALVMPLYGIWSTRRATSSIQHSLVNNHINYISIPRDLWQAMVKVKWKQY